MEPTKEELLKAAELLKEYCAKQDNCDDCLFYLHCGCTFDDPAEHWNIK